MYAWIEHKLYIIFFHGNFLYQNYQWSWDKSMIHLIITYSIIRIAWLISYNFYKENKEILLNTFNVTLFISFAISLDCIAFAIALPPSSNTSTIVVFKTILKRFLIPYSLVYFGCLHALAHSNSEPHVSIKTVVTYGPLHLKWWWR